jgi:RNA polymerase sigma-70 factor, ECF subfamily
MMDLHATPTHEPDWRGLIDRLRPFVVRRVAPSDVDDVVQEVLLRVHRGVDAVRDDQRLGAWLFQVARSAIADHGRARARHPLAATADGDVPAAPVDDHDHVPERLAAVIAFFVARLPSPYREAITLTELEGMSQRDAAGRLGVSLPALKSQVLRGRARLRALLEQCCEIAVDVRGRPVECTPRAPAPACTCTRA